MKLLEIIKKSTPPKNKPIVIVWYESLLDNPRYMIKVCEWNEEHYLYTSDNDNVHYAPNKVIGWIHL